MFTVLLDACVLVPYTLADTVLRIAETGSFGIRWSQNILDEVERNVDRLTGDSGAASRRVQAMRDAFPFANVEGYENLVDTMANDPKDRHVLAAAVRSDCHTIVTFNLADFPSTVLDPWEIEAIHPDEFLISQLDLAPGAVMQALRTQAAGLTNPPRTVADILTHLGLNNSLPRFVDEARRHLEP